MFIYAVKKSSLEVKLVFKHKSQMDFVLHVAVKFAVQFVPDVLRGVFIWEVNEQNVLDVLEEFLSLYEFIDVAVAALPGFLHRTGSFSVLVINVGRLCD